MAYRVVGPCGEFRRAGHFSYRPSPGARARGGVG